MAFTHDDEEDRCLLYKKVMRASESKSSTGYMTIDRFLLSWLAMDSKQEAVRICRKLQENNELIIGGSTMPPAQRLVQCLAQTCCCSIANATQTSQQDPDAWTDCRVVHKNTVRSDGPGILWSQTDTLTTHYISEVSMPANASTSTHQSVVACSSVQMYF